MKQWIFLFVTFFSFFRGLAQISEGIQLKGRIYDAQSREYLVGANVVCLLLKDSSKVGTDFTNKDGSFEFNGLLGVSYCLRITYLGYNSIFKSIDLNEDEKIVNLGSMPMERKTMALMEIDVVANKPSIRIAKDTIEFNAGYYKLREHSVLAELLAKLPGVQIDGSGVIRVNGEVVSTILVDGRPFFSNDPKMVSKNLLTDIVEKVQLLDRKIIERDAATIDAEKTEKAVNIILKKSHKNVWSGEVMTSYGINDRFAAKGNLSRFSEDQQVALLINGDNINGIMDGGRAGSGISRYWNPNFSYTKDINSKISYTGSYSMNDELNEARRASSRQTFIGDTNFFYNQNLITKNSSSSHSIKSQFKVNVAPLLSFVYTNSLSHSLDNTQLIGGHISQGDQRQLLDSGSMNNSGRGSAFDISNQISIDKKFRNDGYKLSFILGFSTTYKREDDYNSSNTLYVQSDGGHVSDSLNQYNTVTNSTQFLQMMVTQVLPIFKKKHLSVSYAFTNTRSPYFRYSYNFNPITGHYDSQEDTLTGSFSNTLTSNFVRVGIKSKGKVVDYEFSLYTMFFNLRTANLLLDGQIKYRTLSLIPRGNFSYNLGRNKRFRVLLTGNPILPGAEQLRTIPDNSNPLYIKLGNPSLKTGSMHDLSLIYNSFNTSRMIFLTLGVDGSFVHNQIINAMWLDSLKRQISRPLNINGSFNFRLYADYSFPIGLKKSIVSGSTSAALRREMNYNNDIKGSSINLAISHSVSYNYTYGDLVNISAVFNYSYNKATYVNQSFSSTDYFSYGFSFNGSLKLPKGFIVGSNMNYSLNTGRGDGYNTNAFMLNAYLSKTLFSNRSGLIKLQGFDVLNQNVNVSRTIGPGYVEDVKANVLQRFFMMSFIYYFKQQK